MRTAAAVGAVALGVALVVAVTTAYESLRVSLSEWVASWLSRGELQVRQAERTEAGLPPELADRVGEVPGVRLVAPRWRHYIDVVAVAPRPAVALKPSPPRRDPSGTGRSEGRGVWHGLLATRVFSRTGWQATGATRPPSPCLPASLEGRGFAGTGVPQPVGTDCIGIDPNVEYQVRGYRAAAGRLLEPGDADGIMLAKEVADALGVTAGDTVDALDSLKRPHALRVVGVILQPKLGLWRRAQSYVLRETLCQLKPEFTAPGAHTLDIALDPLASALDVERRIEALLPEGSTVVATPSQVRPIEEGMRFLGVILIWTSAGALITAWLIIFATLDLAVVERTRELGTLRCVGATRAQLAGSVFAESMPLAAVGVVVGLPLGLGMAKVAAGWFEALFGRFAVSVPGLVFGALGGLAATALAAAVPAWCAARASPVTATRPEARAPRTWLRLPLALGGALLFAGLALAVWGRETISPGQLAAVVIAAWPVGLAGALALLPLLIGLVGRVLEWPVGWLLRLPCRLTKVHFGRTPWRSALVAGALAVGVSLVVNLLTNTESIIAGWALPRKFPGVALGLPEMLGADEERLAKVAGIPGVGRLTPVTAANVLVTEDPASGVGSQAQFLGVDPDAAQEVIQLNFVEGNAREAFAALRRGGAVIVPRQFLRAFNTAYGRRVALLLGADSTVEFTIVGVVESAGLDLVQNYYEESGSFLQALSSRVMIGSAADATNILGAHTYRLILFDFDLPEMLPDAERVSREEAIVASVRAELAPGVPAEMVPAIRMSELKTLIDRDFRHALLWVALAAGVATAVAGLGVVNLMMANVTARARPIAVLRGVGATRGMISRLILAEGLILGLIGSGVGLLHGLFMAAMSNRLDRVAFDIQPKFTVPWPAVAIGLAAAVTVAVVASILPGIHAGRTNVAEALQAG